MEDLKIYNDFNQYIKALKRIADKSLIVIAVRDALTFSNYNHKELYNELQSIGFSINLNGSFRESYIGILNKGTVLYEERAKDVLTPLSYNSNGIQVISKGYSCGNFCSIKKDGDEYALNGIGLNIVVFDAEENNFIDSVSVNLLKESVTMSRYEKSAWENKLLELKRFGIQPFTFYLPKLDDIQNKSDWETLLYNLIIESGNRQATQGIIAKNVDKYYELSGMNTCYDSIEEFKEHLNNPCRVLRGNLYSKNVYYKGKYLNIDWAGRRMVTDTPADYDFTVHMFGDSVGLLWEIKDSDTAASRLQNLFNVNGIKAKVINYSVAGLSLDNIMNYITDSEIKQGDIVVVLCSGGKSDRRRESWLKRNGIYSEYMVEEFQRPHNYGEVFYDANHFNHNGLKVVAEIMFDKINDYLQTMTYRPVVDKPKGVLPPPNFQSYPHGLLKLKNIKNKSAA
ncbi:MAG: hypothetical protein LUD27_02905 [Clostridia bacterium]|nr:hypothetical protein [Clostridia bacterium]